MDAVGKCNFTDYVQIKNIRDLCDKNRFIYALGVLFRRKEIWETEWILKEFQQSDAASYCHYSMPLLFYNVNFTVDQCNVLFPLKGSEKFGPFDDFTPEVFQTIAEKKQSLLVEILDRLNCLAKPDSFLPLLKIYESNASIATPLKELIFKDSSTYKSILERNDFDDYEDIFENVLQIEKTSKSLRITNDTLDLIEKKYDDEFYCDMVYCTKDLQCNNISKDKLLSIIKKAPDEKALEEFLLYFKDSDKLDEIFYNQTFDETKDDKFLKLLKGMLSNADSSKYQYICGKRIEHATDTNDPFFESFCPGKNKLITTESYAFVSLIVKALKKFNDVTVSKSLEHIHENGLSFEQTKKVARSIINENNEYLAKVALLNLKRCDCLKDLNQLKEWLENCFQTAYKAYSYSFSRLQYPNVKSALVALCEEINQSDLTNLVKPSSFNQKQYMEYCRLGFKYDNEIFTQLCPALPDENIMQWLQEDMCNMIGAFLKSEHQHLETILINVEVALGKTLLPENIKVKHRKYVDETEDYDIYSRKYFIMGANQNDTMIISHLCVMSLCVKYMLSDYGYTNENVFGNVFDKLKNNANTFENLLTGIEESFKEDLKILNSYKWAEFAVKYGNDVFKAFCSIEQVKKYDNFFKTRYNYIKRDNVDAMKLDHMREVKQALGIKWYC